MVVGERSELSYSLYLSIVYDIFIVVRSIYMVRHLRSIFYIHLYIS